MKTPVISLRSAPYDREALKALRGTFTDGYTPEDVNRVCSTIRDVTGIVLGIVWEVYDDAGFGGNSDFAVAHAGKLHECEGGLEELSTFLNDDGPCPASFSVTLGKEIATETDQNYNYEVKDLLREARV